MLLFQSHHACAASNSAVIDHKFSGQKSMMRTDTKCHTHITLKIQSGVPGVSLFFSPRFPKREKSGLLNNLQKLVQSNVIT